MFDDLIPPAPPASRSGGGMFDDLIPPAPRAGVAFDDLIPPAPRADSRTPTKGKNRRGDKRKRETAEEAFKRREDARQLDELKVEMSEAGQMGVWGADGRFHPSTPKGKGLQLRHDLLMAKANAGNVLNIAPQAAGSVIGAGATLGGAVADTLNQPFDEEGERFNRLLEAKGLREADPTAFSRAGADYAQALQEHTDSRYPMPESLQRLRARQRNAKGFMGTLGAMWDEKLGTAQEALFQLAQFGPAARALGVVGGAAALTGGQGGAGAASDFDQEWQSGIIQQSPRYKELAAKVGEDAAYRQLKGERIQQSVLAQGAVGGATAGISSKLGGNFVDDLLAGKAAAGSVGKKVAGELATESLFEEPLDAITGNIVARNTGSNRDLLEGVPEASAQALATTLPIAGGFAAPEVVEGFRVRRALTTPDVDPLLAERRARVIDTSNRILQAAPTPAAAEGADLAAGAFEVARTARRADVRRPLPTAGAAIAPTLPEGTQVRAPGRTQQIAFRGVQTPQAETSVSPPIVQPNPVEDRGDELDRRLADFRRERGISPQAERDAGEIGARPVMDFYREPDDELRSRGGMINFDWEQEEAAAAAAAAAKPKPPAKPKRPDPPEFAPNGRRYGVAPEDAEPDWAPPEMRNAAVREAEGGELADAFLGIAQAGQQAFQLPQVPPEARTIEDIAAVVDPEVQIVKWEPKWLPKAKPGNPTIIAAYSITMRDGTDATFTVEEGGGTQLNASALEEGKSGGASLYAIVNTFAQRNGLKALPDRQGLTEINKTRRTEQQAASAIRTQTTQHLVPDITQTVAGFNIDGQDRANTGALITKAFSNTISALPELHSLRYNFDTAQFEWTNGERADDADFDRLAGTNPAREVGIGRSTIKRAVLAASVLREVRRRGVGSGKILGELGRQQLQQLVAPALEQLFYSRGAVNGSAQPDTRSDRDTAPRAPTRRAAERSAARRAEPRNPARTAATVWGDIASGMGSRFARRLRAQPWLYVVNSRADLPAQHRGKLTPSEIVGGFYAPNGDVVIIADELREQAEDGSWVDTPAVAVMLHELGVHYGMRGMLGDSFAGILQRFEALRDSDPAVAAAFARVPRDTKPQHVAEEALAYFVQQNYDKPVKLMDRIIAAVKAFLRRFGIDRDFSPDQLLALARGAASKASRGQFRERYAAREDSAEGREALAFSRAPKPAEVAPVREELSTQKPTAVKARGSELKTLMVVGLGAVKRAAKAYAKNVQLLVKYPNYKPSAKAKTDDQKVERLIDHMVKNLLWLHDQVPKELRQRAKLWYDGANAIANRWADKYGISVPEAGGVLAVLSPQKDWFMNVSLAERVLDTVLNHATAPWSPEMQATTDRIFEAEKYATLRGKIEGKALRDLTDRFERAAWVRIYSETYHSPTHPVITPEGDFAGLRRSTKGKKKPVKVAWGSLSEIAKAVAIIDDPRLEVISEMMGAQHKVRNFYNNIVSPGSAAGHVTIDTHAVAAALLRPLAGSSTEVLHNFGGGGAASDSQQGVKGTYGIYAEAYRRAAEAREILPREMQSITWEAVRGMFRPSFKSKKENRAAVRAVWNTYRRGGLSHEDAQQRVLDLANGIDTFEWAGSRAGVDASEWGASFTPAVAGAGLPGGRARPASRRAGSPDSGGADVLRSSGGADAAITEAVHRFRSRRGRDGRAPRAYARGSASRSGTLRGLNASAVAVYTATEEFTNAVSSAGVATPDFAELDDAPASATAFHKAISEAKAANRHGAAVHVYDEADYRKMRLFVTPDGKAGFALKGDDIVSVFGYPSSYRGIARPILELAVQEGGRRLDAFNTVLPAIYAGHGFRTAARLPWNDEFAPEGWDKETFAKYNGGEPDVVFMVHDPDFFGAPDVQSVGYAEDYDAAVAAQTKALTDNDGILKSSTSWEDQPRDTLGRFTVPRKLPPKGKRFSTSTKNEYTDEERELLGKDPVFSALPTRGHEELVIEARRKLNRNRLAADQLAADVVSGRVTSVSETQETLLLVGKVELMRQRGDAARRSVDKRLTEFNRAKARIEWEELEVRITQLDTAVKTTGAIWARTGHLRQRVLMEDFTFDSMAEKLARAHGRALTVEESEEVKQLSETLLKQERELAKAREAADYAADVVESARLLADMVDRAADYLRKEVRTASRPFLQMVRAAAEASRAALARMDDAKIGVNRPGQRGQSGAVDVVRIFHITRIGLANLVEMGYRKADWTQDKYIEWRRRMRRALGERKYNYNKELLPGIFKQATLDLDKIEASRAERVRAALEIEGELTHADVYELIEALVEAGVHGEAEVMAEATKRLQETQPGITERDVRRLFTEYGKVRFPSKDAVSREVRELRELQRMQESIDRLEEGLPALKTGQQRDKTTAAIRERRRQLNERLRIEAARAGPDPARLATLQDARISNLKNLIADLQRMLETGERPAKIPSAPATPEMEALQAQVAELRKKIREVDRTGTRAGQRKLEDLKTREQKLADRLAVLQQRVLKGDSAPKPRAKPEDSPIQQQIAALQAQLRALERAKKPQMPKAERTNRARLRALEREQELLEKELLTTLRRPAGAPVPPTAEVEAKAAAVKALREQVRALRESLLTPEQVETRYQEGVSKLLNRQLKAIGARPIARRPARPVPKPLSPENRELQLQVRKAKHAFAVKLFEAEMAKRTVYQKAWGAVVEGFNVARAVMTSMDLSAVLRQSLFTFGHPVIAARVGRKMLEAAISEARNVDIEANIRRRTNYPLYEAAGLHLTESHGFDPRKVEEQFVGRWLEKIEKIEGESKTRAAGRIAHRVLTSGVRASGRAYSTYTNLMRVEMFDLLHSTLVNDPAAPSLEELKAVANLVNVFTGRGSFGKTFDTGGQAASMLLFAPRYVASRFNVLTLQPFWHGQLNRRERLRVASMAAKEYARTMAGMAAIYMLAAAAQGLTDDDDDEDWAVTFDPRSSDFGKIRFGNVYLDPLAGLSQALVFMARVGSQEVAVSDRDTGELEVRSTGPDRDYGQRSGWEVMADFVRSKLSPMAGFATTALTGEGFGGKPMSVTDAAMELGAPLAIREVEGVVKDRGMPEGMALMMLSWLGMGIQYRDPDRWDEIKEARADYKEERGR